MEKLQDEQWDDVRISNRIFQDFENIALEHNINLECVPPRQFNYIINQISKNFIQPNKKVLLKLLGSQYNEYDLNRVQLFYIIYKDLCSLYNQECKISLYSSFVDIPIQTISEWATTGRCDLLKIIHKDNEESLNELLLDKSVNPVKAISILNYKHNWSGQIQAQELQTKALAMSNLPSLEQFNN